MTHVPESKFSLAVGNVLKEMYPDATVEQEPYLSTTGRYADWVVYDTPLPLAVEVENDAESAIAGLGQALIYAWETEAIPIVVLPEGHWISPELDILSNHAHFVQMSVPSEFTAPVLSNGTIEQPGETDASFVPRADVSAMT